MDLEGLGEDPDKPRPKPRVIDKRVSAQEPGAAPPPPPPPRPTEEAAPPQEVKSEPAPAPDQPADVPTPAGVSTPAASQDQEAQARQIAQEIAETPSYEWVVNTAVTLANVAGTKLDLGAAADAQLAIDALGGILDALGPRLDQAEAPLRQTLAQLRLAYAERVAPPTP